MKKSLLVSLLALISAAAAQAAPAAPANYFVCDADDLRIVYNGAPKRGGASTVSVSKGTGEPSLVSDPSFEKTSIGTLVVIGRQYAPDLESVVTRILLPEVTIRDKAEEFETLLIETTYPTTFFGTVGVDGPLSTSKTRAAHCKAQFVIS